MSARGQTRSCVMLEISEVDMVRSKVLTFIHLSDPQDLTAQARRVFIVLHWHVTQYIRVFSD